MKKYGIVLLSALLLFSLAGCNEFKDIRSGFQGDKGGRKTSLSNAEIAGG